MLATIGVLATGGMTAVGAHFFGLGWRESLLLGAVVSSTDAATVFAVLRGSRLSLKPRLGATLELESGLNDPMAVILTVALTEAFAPQLASIGAERADLNAWAILRTMAWEVPLQLLVGGGVGIGLGFGARWVLSRVTIATVGLYPVVTLATAFIAFGVATVSHGSGFLAVYLAAMVLGNGPLPLRGGVARVHDAIAWLSQISMFLMLGLLVFPSRLPSVAGIGLGVALFLAFVARPLSVWACLLPFRFPARESAYIGWVGLRGAVPIILATFPVLSRVPGAEKVFDIVFFVVVINAIIPGATIRPLTRRWKLQTSEKPTPAALLEINSVRPLGGQLVSFHIDPSLAVCGATLSQVQFPPKSAAVMLVRDSELAACRGDTELKAGDHLYVFCQPADRPYFELLFGRAQQDDGE
jgi:cell volume regulation protein A